MFTRPEPVVVGQVHLLSHGDVLDIRETLDLACRLAGPREDREEHRCQDPDDRNHDQELDQGEASSSCHLW